MAMYLFLTPGFHGFSNQILFLVKLVNGVILTHSLLKYIIISFAVLFSPGQVVQDYVGKQQTSNRSLQTTSQTEVLRSARKTPSTLQQLLPVSKKSKRRSVRSSRVRTARSAPASNVARSQGSPLFSWLRTVPLKFAKVKETMAMGNSLSQWTLK